MNAAIWFGAAVFFTLAVGPAFFSSPVKELLGPVAYPFYSTALEHLLLDRYFLMHQICGAVALAHLIAEWLYANKKIQPVLLWMAITLFTLSLAGGLLLQPALKNQHLILHDQQRPAEHREKAARFLSFWRGVVQTGNVLANLGLLFYLWRVTAPATPARFYSANKFRG